MLSVRPISDLRCIRWSTLAKRVQRKVLGILPGPLGIPMTFSQTMTPVRVILLAAGTMMFLVGPAAAQNSGPATAPEQRGHNNARPVVGPNGATAHAVAGARTTGEANRAGNTAGVTPTSGNPNQYGPYASSGGYGLWGLLGLIGLFGLFRGGSRPVTPDYTRRP
jgi:hypothetical protein